MCVICNSSLYNNLVNHLKVLIKSGVFLFFLLLLNAACREAVKSISELSALRDELIREYKHEDINVVIQNSNVLGITFSNSSFNDLSEQDRARKAREIALFAKKHYISIDSIDTIWVSFAISNTYIIFHINNGLGTYVFNKRDLTPSGIPRAQSEKAVASYDPSLKQTTVYLSKNLQLYSSSGHNVSLFPRLIISADGTKAPRRALPESVGLDFTSYSDRRMFPSDPRLVINVDGQEVFSGKARLTNAMGTNAEKSVNEFISHDISYSQFLRMAGGRQTKIFLGPMEFDLTGEQLKSLQSIRKCVEESSCQ